MYDEKPDMMSNQNNEIDEMMMMDDKQWIRGSPVDYSTVPVTTKIAIEVANNIMMVTEETVYNLWNGIRNINLGNINPLKKQGRRTRKRHRRKGPRTRRQKESRKKVRTRRQKERRKQVRTRRQKERRKQVRTRRRS